ncbi:DUF4268 domain-containing protein [Mesonia sp. HuA40]|uniref:DUF4268 domain-containing protein n=1 Tax=Mesonia sp. HuA40 TaxID=2602761 RepID=UPI0011CB400B|nr:DUF4268 domain-containing protein [Mesonia sp. HuA40]TXK71041.1 DUF4268 domain-containing protein [Mesonia sp. HuA40]
MFSKSESKKIREEFWTQFGKQSPKKWILYDTKIKAIDLKFNFDTKGANLGIKIDAVDSSQQEIYWNKFISLKQLLLDEVSPDFIFDINYEVMPGKYIGYIYIPLEEKVSIHNKNSWEIVIPFFNKNMLALEHFFIEYYDIIKA